MTKEKLLDTARVRFKLCIEAEQKQRDREKEDLQFQVPELQWTETARRQREGDGNTVARPCLSVSIVDQPMQLLYNQMRGADLGIGVHPISEDADPDTAEVIQGLYRDIERQSRAELARAWAYKRAIACGTGAYRILTEYDDRSSNETDQRIVVRRILHQEAVYFDPTAEQPDWSDGRYAFVVQYVSKEAFKDQFPGVKIPASDNRQQLENLTNIAPNWVRADDVLVAEYWWKEITYRTKRVGKDEHKIPETTVKRVKMCGWDILEPEVTWIGRYIPIVRVLGSEIVPFDDERRYVGIIGPAKDPQRVHNHGISAVVEKVSLEPKAPFVGLADQFEPYRDMWATANIKNWSYLPYAAVRLGDSYAPPPQRSQVDTTGASLGMMLVDMGRQGVQSSTAIFDPSLGRENPAERSGRALLALQQQADAATSQFLTNLVDAMQYEALVVMDLMPKIYDRAERIIRIIRGDDKKSEPIMINARHYVDQKTKRPVALRDGQPPPMMPGPPMPPAMPMMPPGGPGPGMPPGPGGPPMPPPGPPPMMPAEVKEFDLTRGIYDVAITVAKSYQTRLQEGSDRIGELISKEPSMAAAFLDIFLQFQDWPGAKEMAKRAAKYREITIPGLGEGEQGKPNPDQLQAQMQQMSQALQMTQAQLQAAIQEIKTKQAEQQTTLMKAEMDNSTRIKVAEIQADAQLALKGMETKMSAILDLLKLQKETRLEREQRLHEAAEAEHDREHEAVQGALERAHGAVQGRIQHSHETNQAREAAEEQRAQEERDAAAVLASQTGEEGQ